MTQEEQILDHLRKGYALTPLDALKLFGCLRLGARIWDLRRKGHNIEMKVIETPGGKHVAQYKLNVGEL